MEFLKNVSLKDFTTLRVGGAASFFIAVASMEEVRDAVRKARRENLPFRVIGGGSNIIALDEGFSGLIIKNEIEGVGYEEVGDAVFITAGAGESWDALVEDTVQRGLFGLENLSGIPGTVGGAPIQNIGAYGSEVKSTIEWVEIYDANTDSVRKLANEKCEFAYRDSVFKTEEGKNWIVTRVQFKLLKKGTLSLGYKDIQAVLAERGIVEPTISELREIILSIRSNKFPNLKEYGTAGSFFKNPFITADQLKKVQEFYPDIPTFPAHDSLVKIPIAYVLERLPEQYKGKKFGSVGLYANHSLVVVNYGDATANEILSFAEKIIREVKEQIQIPIDMEVQVIK